MELKSPFDFDENGDRTCTSKEPLQSKAEEGKAPASEIVHLHEGVLAGLDDVPTGVLGDIGHAKREGGEPGAVVNNLRKGNEFGTLRD